MKFPRRRLCLLFLLPVFALVFTLFLKNKLLLTEDQRFEAFTREIFLEEVRGNTLNLHYTLAHPEAYGIEEYPITLGSMEPENLEQRKDALRALEKKLKDFSPRELSRENQITYEILSLEFSTQLSDSNDPLLWEPLGPNLGIQAQLPVLLAEYTFRSPKDIRDYFSLLASMPRYFQEILSFEEEKSSRGLFMSDVSAQRIIRQCQAFLENSSPHYLTSMFRSQLETLQNQKKISGDQAASYLSMQEKLMRECVYPAYEQLSQGIFALQGTGKNENGLFYFPQGKEYYQYLIQSTVGDYRSLEEIETRLRTQLLLDGQELYLLQQKDPDLLDKAILASSVSPSEPEEILDYLRTVITTDFPALETGEYQVKYVPEEMEDFSSPAFYLTPPIDTLSPNTIYINQGSLISGTELFTTLAHEGFPGHLYQTVYFGTVQSVPLRSLLSCSGYIEGWATYVESLSYDYGADFLQIEPEVMRFLWLNRSVSLCLYSLLDLGIHGSGWNFTSAWSMMESLGITQEETAREIFQYIVENPANYLKYYLGYLNFCDLKTKALQELGEDFSLKDFHSRLLRLGPAPFPIVEKYLFSGSDQTT